MKNKVKYVYKLTKSSYPIDNLLKDGWEIYGYELNPDGVELKLKKAVDVIIDDKK